MPNLVAWQGRGETCFAPATVLYGFRLSDTGVVTFETVIYSSMGKRDEWIQALVFILVVLGGIAGTWLWVESNDPDWRPREPTEVSVWLTPRPAGVQNAFIIAPGATVYSLQQFVSDRTRPIIAGRTRAEIVIGETPIELEIDTGGRNRSKWTVSRAGFGARI